MRPEELMPAYEGGPQVSAAARFARAMLGCALRYWPEDSRAWGTAMAAEIDEATNGFDAMWWSLGGLMFFARSVLSSTWAWLKLPAGSSLPGSGAGGVGGPLMPKRSRLFTAVVLAVAAVLLLLPEGREALRTVTASWLEYEMTSSDQRALDKLAARAEKEKDAGTLAFVALSPTPRHDSAHHSQQLERTAAMVERAVALDPSYIWVYGAKNHRHDYYPAQKEWVTRLEMADPDNAVPILIEADAYVEQKFATRYARNYPTEKDFENLGDDPQWTALMGRAYAAPKYDSYLQKHLQLMRAVWDRDPNLPPEIFLEGLWSHTIPDLRLLRTYAKVRLEGAEKAKVSGDFKQAEAVANGVAAFGARMMSSSGTVIEELIGVAISRMADKELAAIYTSEGKIAEAQAATAHSDELERSVRKRIGRDEAGRAERRRGIDREAALVQGCAILGGMSLLAAVVGVLFVELWPNTTRAQRGWWCRAMCFAADYGPSAVLIASGAFLICFRPFQKVLADFRVSSFQLDDEHRLTDAMWSLTFVPEHVLGMDSAVTFWSALTITLSAVVVAMVASGIYRARRVASRA